jgi:hypothetical protein
LKTSFAAVVLPLVAGLVHGQQPIPPAPVQTKAQLAKKVTVPARLHLPVLWPEIGRDEKEGSLNEIAKNLRQDTLAGQRAVVVQAVCVRVPAGFCERAGLKANRGGDKQPAGGAWTLGHREAKMFGALLRSESGEVITCPMVLTQDGQVAKVDVCQPITLAGGTKAVASDGSSKTVSVLEKCETGVNLQVHPEVSADGRYVRLKVTAKWGWLEDSGSPSAVQVSESVVVVPTGGTAVLKSPVGCTQAASGKKPGEVLWVLTAHIVEGRKQPAASDTTGQKPATPSSTPKQ